MMLKQKTTSLADQVFERLEADILSGVYSRGEILTELKLSEDLQVSRTPIREALRRLEQEHIVEATGKGMKVLSITEKDAAAIYEIRMQIEMLAVRNCARHVSEEQVQAMRELVELQEFYATKGNSEQLKITDAQFHSMIYDSCSSSIYADTLNPLLAKLQKVRKTSLEDPYRAVASVAEHRMLLNAIAAHNADAAVGAIRVHISNATANMETLKIIEGEIDI